MKKRNRLLLLVIALVGLGLAAWMAFTAVLIGSTLSSAQRDIMATILAPRMVLAVMSWAMAVALAWAGLRVVFRRYLGGSARLLEQTRILLKAETPQQMGAQATPQFQALAQAINELAGQRDALRQDMAQRVAQASEGVQQEKNRLSALVSELTQSVVVCNLDGRVVLYNNRARLQFRALSKAPTLTDGGELLGIGRSIYTVFDRQLVDHALETLQHRIDRGAATPTAQFVTSTRSGQLLSVQMAPVRGEEAPSGGAAQINGFVLMLDNVTRTYEEETQRDQTLSGLLGNSRASLANMQGAIEALSSPNRDLQSEEHWFDVLKGEVHTMRERMAELSRDAALGLKTRWPLEEMFGADLLSAAQRRIETQCKRSVTIDESTEEVWLRVDSFSLLQALTYLAWRLVDEFEIRFLQLRLQAAGGRAQLDLIWSDRAMSTETVMSWEMEPMQIGEQSLTLSVRDVVERHGGEILFQRERVRHRAFFRFVLPLASAQEQAEVVRIVSADGRPEFYDFDLFQATDESRALDEQLLTSLAYTVFDTETTGLNPSQGDEIIQIGAVRIVNGKLLYQECFDQLVDPGRPIPAASIPIHGITQAMVRGQPGIGQVLPAFHVFALDTVLVAHNSAFDMKFLQLKEVSTGLAFHQPVLDTLLLSAVVHPNQESHRLEAIAERLGIVIRDRHRALGDATVTAEVLLRLIPLLDAMGIRTLQQARDAAQKTYYARLKY